MTRPATRYSGPIRSTSTPRPPTNQRRPYDRLRDIERRARAGERMNEPAKETPVILATIEPKIDFKPKPRPATAKVPRGYGQIIADQLLTSDDPMGVMLRAEKVTNRELHVAQQSGTRWCKYAKRPDLRLSYRRTGMDEVAWFLTERTVNKEETP